ncbi:MAG: hypothetical protein DIU68_015065 [Chloroflexota bacterium]|nr:MAG: hypothetical protein DIU68_03180 [Chloroflexota bacterium]
MYVQRRPEVRPRRNSSLAWLGCGCATALGLFAVIIVLAVVLLAPRLPEIAASAIGMSAQGKTEEIFQPEPPRPTVELQNASQPQQVTVNLGSYGGSQTITTDTSYYEVIVGSDPIGQQTAVVTFTEDGLMEICRQQNEVCRGGDPRFQNIRLDLKPGGAIVFADVSLPTQYGVTIQQTAGVVLRLDSTRRQLQFAGIDLNGTLYTDPPPELAGTVQEFERIGNDVLNQITINAGGGELALREAQIDETTLTLIMQ